MRRQLLTRTDENDTTRWFDLDKAEKYPEDTWWDGSNNISRATGSQFDHQVLLRTAGGHWVLHEWSEYQDVSDTWILINQDDAYEWLLRNGHGDVIPDDVPAAHDLDSERPGQTPKHTVRLSDDALQMGIA